MKRWTRVRGGAVAPTRLRRRVAVAFVLAVGVSTGVLAVGSYVVVRNARLDDSANRFMHQTVLNLRFAYTQPDVRAFFDGLPARSQSSAVVVLVRGGRPQTSGGVGAAQIPSELRRLVGQGRLARERVVVGGRHYVVVGGALPETQTQYYFFYDEQQMWNDLAVLRNVLALGWLVLVVLAGLGGTLFARRTLAPVAEASNAARSLAEGLLDTRLPVAGDDEFGAWASAFNDMAAALEARMADLAEARERERRFTANVAHDLRSPLTALIGEARQLQLRARELPPEFQRLTQMLVADVDRLCRLTEDLLEISRLDSKQEPAELEPVDVAKLVRGVLRAHSCSDVVELDAHDVVLMTDRRRLERIVANLIENAVTHAGVGVHVSVTHQQGQALIEVTDAGPGIPAAALPHIFDRQFKADRSRSRLGSGLGLAIARENARLLGGDITATSTPGAGANFKLRLPVAEPFLDGGSVVADPSEDAGETTSNRKGRP
jgi:two-component system, OmpR family, sensor histidine kinase MtrB